MVFAWETSFSDGTIWPSPRDVLYRQSLHLTFDPATDSFRLARGDVPQAHLDENGWWTVSVWYVADRQQGKTFHPPEDGDFAQIVCSQVADGAPDKPQPLALYHPRKQFEKNGGLVVINRDCGKRQTPLSVPFSEDLRFACRSHRGAPFARGADFDPTGLSLGVHLVKFRIPAGFQQANVAQEQQVAHHPVFALPGT